MKNIKSIILTIILIEYVLFGSILKLILMKNVYGSL